eukprot:symbB.v1.2.014571.t1/scaffold1041.1/size142482/1
MYFYTPCDSIRLSVSSPGDAGGGIPTGPTDVVETAEATKSNLEELISMGFLAEEAKEALRNSHDDINEALTILTQGLAKKRQRGDEHNSISTDETLEVEGIQCALTKEDELVMLLPGDELRVGPVVGRRATHDGSLVFDGMDDWLGELYEGHKPRSFTGELPSFDVDAALAALEDETH